VTIRSEQDWQGMKRAGGVVKEALATMEAAIEPGITTLELDLICSQVFAKHGAKSAPNVDYNAPVHAFISVNDDVVHGLPTKRALVAGDVVTLDVTPYVDGYVADAAKTIIVSGLDEDSKRYKKSKALIDCAEAAFWSGMKVLRTGKPLNLVGKTIEREVEKRGFKVIRELSGHGVGRKIHEEPTVLNFYHKRFRQKLTENLVLAVEPMVSAGSPYIDTKADGWTIGTTDRSLTAHYEHTVVVKSGRPVMLTA